MNIVCLDMEGVVTPEIWIAFAEAVGMPEFRRTTKEEPDYDKLMKWRIALLKERGLGMKQIREAISTIDPLPGAKEFLDELRSFAQVVILTDSFDQFAMPLIEKLNRPTLFCNTLIIDQNDNIADYTMRCQHSKLTTVRALQSCGFNTIAAGDSYNDLEMIRASNPGFLFRSPKHIQEQNPDIPAYESYDDFLAAIKAAY